MRKFLSLFFLFLFFLFFIIRVYRLSIYKRNKDAFEIHHLKLLRRLRKYLFNNIYTYTFINIYSFPFLVSLYYSFFLFQINLHPLFFIQGERFELLVLKKMSVLFFFVFLLVFSLEIEWHAKCLCDKQN